MAKGAISGYDSPTAVAPDVMQFVNTEENREARIQQARELEKSRKEAADEKVEDLRIGAVKFDEGRINPILKDDFDLLQKEFFGKVADSIDNSRSSESRKLGVSQLTQDFGGKLQQLYDESAQYNMIDPSRNPNAQAVLDTHPELSLLSQALIQSGYDKERFWDLSKNIPNTMNEWHGFEDNNPNYNPDNLLKLRITPTQQKDWQQVAHTSVAGIKGSGITSKKTPNGDEVFFSLGDENSPDYKAYDNNTNIAISGDVGAFNNWMAKTGYHDPSIWVDGKLPVNSDGTTNVNAKLDKQAAMQAYRNTFKEYAKSIITSEKPIHENESLTFSQKVELENIKAKNKLETGTGMTEGERLGFVASIKDKLDAVNNLKVKIADEKAAITAVAMPNSPESKPVIEEHKQKIASYQDELDKNQKVIDRVTDNWQIMQEYHVPNDERAKYNKVSTDDLPKKLKADGYGKDKTGENSRLDNKNYKKGVEKKGTAPDDDFEGYRVNNLKIPNSGNKPPDKNFNTSLKSDNFNDKNIQSIQTLPTMNEKIVSREPQKSLLIRDVPALSHPDNIRESIDTHSIEGIPFKHIDIYEDEKGNLQLRPVPPPINIGTQTASPAFKNKKEGNKNGLNGTSLNSLPETNIVSEDNTELPLRGTPDTSLTSPNSKIIPDNVKKALAQAKEDVKNSCQTYDSWLELEYPQLSGSQRELLYFIYLDRIDGSDFVPVSSWSKEKKEAYIREQSEKMGEYMEDFREKDRKFIKKFGL